MGKDYSTMLDKNYHKIMYILCDPNFIHSCVQRTQNENKYTQYLSVVDLWFSPMLYISDFSKYSIRSRYDFYYHILKMFKF